MPASYRLCLVGLGNPGARYDQTRHNLGFRFIDQILSQCSESYSLRVSSFKDKAEAWQGIWKEERLLLIKPVTFMNNSGEAVSEAVRWFRLDPPSQLMLAFDDLDLPLGAVRLRAKGSAGTHNGMASVVEKLGRTDFPRLKLGIGPKPLQADAADFVLSRFSPQEKPITDEMMEKASKVLESYLTGGIEYAVSKFSE